MVDRLIPIAIQEDLSKFNNIFFSDTRKRLTDSHLWISIFSRPNKSNFSRVQRLSTVFSLLMMSMLTSAMFYKAETDLRNTQGYSLGPFKFTLQEVFISVVTSLLVFPVTMLIDQLFRKSKPKSRQKNQAFEYDRPASAFSKFSLRFSSVLRVQTRTQVTPIPSDSQSDESNQDHTLNRESFHATPKCAPPSGSITTPPPSPVVQRSEKQTHIQRPTEDTPVPSLFSKTVRMSPSLYEARHHYSPAPPLFLKFKPGKSVLSQKYRPNLTISFVDKPEVQHLEQKSPIPSTSDQLTPNSRNSPNISPQSRCETPGTDSIFSFDSSASDEIENIDADTPIPQKTSIFQRRIALPHWCVYIAWLLVFLTSSLSATLTFLYSMEWGKEKSVAWLTSMLLAVLESVSIIQPAKVDYVTVVFFC